MTHLHSLTVRTNAAFGRLADLQRRAQEVTTAGRPVVKSVLKELTTALEELKAASDRLERNSEELAALRTHCEATAARLEEFIETVPIACLWTDQAGVIVESNDAAAALLNVARPRLAGKPLLLFVADRSSLFHAMSGLRAVAGGAVELETLVRPRERRPRNARLTARVMNHDNRWCWFIRASEEIDSRTPLESS
jgi:PAS domain-containing protein